ncbi:MAG: EFR1 family ferrodoxin [Spirochaetales bacterium]|nr:EFR1 family ferrodoxin [Spirochaetales bacterium]
MKTQLFYFSGTGNSLYVARELEKMIPRSVLVPMVGALDAGCPGTEAPNVGFVFPCHGMTIPSVVREFLKKTDMTSSSYFFAIATRGGSIFRGFPLIDTLLKKQGKRLKARFVITMGMNDPKLSAFTVPAGEELAAFESSVRRKSKEVAEIVLHKKDHAEDSGGVKITGCAPLNFFLDRLIPFMVHFLSAKVKKYFYADSKCDGCGICAKVCPSQKIVMRDGKPVWQKRIGCYVCYACLNFCPREAVQIYSKVWMKSYTQEKGRYPHPYASVNDIAKQRKM